MKNSNYHLSILRSLLLIVSLNLLIFNYMNSQCECFLNYYKGESFYFNQTDKHLSVQYFRKAFEDPKFGSLSDVYNAFDIAYRLDSLVFAESLLKLALQKGEDHIQIGDFILKYYPKFQYDKAGLKKISDSLKLTELKIDSLLLNDLVYMKKRDQKIREDEEINAHSLMNMGITEHMNYLWLKEIIIKNGGKLPTVEQVGWNGIDIIELLIIHMDITSIIDLWPYFIHSIHEDKLPIGERLLYQLDRIMTLGTNIVYIKNSKLETKNKNKKIPNSKHHYQNLGGIDIPIPEERKKYWWPFNPNIDIKNTDNIRKALCLDSLEESKKRLSYIKYFTPEEFLEKSARW